MKKKIIVLSMDAMVTEDLAYLQQKPHFSRIFEHAATVGHVETIFPSITYPAHVSMMTGCRPGKTGVYTNFRHNVNPPGYPDWIINASEVSVENIFAAAKRAGLSTASVYWPVTGNDPNIDWNINELFFYLGEEIEPHFREYGANDEAIEVILENLDRWPKPGPVSPVPSLERGFDNFINGCMCSLIRRHQPDLLLAHNCILDTTRHRNGVFHDNVLKALDITDEWLGEIADALTDAGVYDDTDFILVSDHGQRNTVRNIRPNALLRRGGFLSSDEEGRIIDWKARAIPNGMSAYFTVKNHDEAVRRELFDYLTALAADGVWGFKEVHSSEEIKERYGVYGDFDFVVNTDGYTSFIPLAKEPLVISHDLSDYRSGKATHGYFPEDGAQPVFVAAGPSFKPGAHIEKASVIDEAPTYAYLFGERLPEAEGRVLHELLNENACGRG